MPPLGKTLGQALGKLFSNLRSARWHGGETATAGVAIFVLNPAGQKVRAWYKGHFTHDGGKLGDHHVDDASNEYINVDGKIYRYDPQRDEFYHATAN